MQIDRSLQYGNGLCQLNFPVAASSAYTVLSLATVNTRITSPCGVFTVATREPSRLKELPLWERWVSEFSTSVSSDPRCSCSRIVWLCSRGCAPGRSPTSTSRLWQRDDRRGCVDRRALRILRSGRSLGSRSEHLHKEKREADGKTNGCMKWFRNQSTFAHAISSCKVDRVDRVFSLYLLDVLPVKAHIADFRLHATIATASLNDRFLVESDLLQRVSIRGQLGVAGWVFVRPQEVRNDVRISLTAETTRVVVRHRGA